MLYLKWQPLINNKTYKNDSTKTKTMSKEEFLKLSDLDKVKYAIEESLKEHKGYKSEYWKGSAFKGESISQTIEQVKEFAITDVSQQRELLAFRKWQKDNWKDVHLYSDEFMISEFKKANCG